MTSIAWIPIICRAILGFLFVFAGICNCYYYKSQIEHMKSRNVPMATLVFWIGVVSQIIAGTLFIFNYWIVWATIWLILFTILGTIIFHNFWDMKGDAFRVNMLKVVTNISTIAALCFIAYYSV